MSSDLDFDSLKLNGQTISAEVRSAITEAKLTRTIDSSPTLSFTIQDAKRAILKSGLFAQRVTAQLDDHSFEIAQVKKTGNKLSVVMEDLAVAELRRHNEPFHAPPGTVTRVMFVKQLLAAETPWIQLFVDPSVREIVATVELARGQVPASTTDSADPNYFNTGSASTAPSVSSSNSLTPAQIAGAAKAAGFSGQGLVIAVAVALAESGGRPAATNHNTNGSTDYGLWQINSIHAAILASGTWSDPLSNAKMAFTISGGGTNWKPWVTFNTGAYKSHLHDAQTAAGTPSSDYATAGQTTVDESNLEDSWTCFKRIFREVNWRLYADKGNLYAGPDSAFIDKDPIVTFREFQSGVDNIDFDFDTGKPVSTATISCRADRWICPPGSVIAIPEMNLIEKWLCSSIERNLFSKQTTITASSPQPEYPEPAGTLSGANSGYFGDATPGTPTTATGEASDGAYIWPTASHTVTAPFGQDRPGHKHTGIDIGVSVGTSVVASRGGTVQLAGNVNPTGYGNQVIIRHDDGQYTYYAHLSRFSVPAGIVVKQGQEIGKSGGQPGTPGAGDATGPHLHFEIRINANTPIDPLTRLSDTQRSQIIAGTNRPIVVPNKSGGATIFTNDIPLIP